MKPDKTTLGEYFEKWLADYAKPNISPRGFERYRGIIKQYFIPEMGNITLTQLRSEHLQGHYTVKLNSGLSTGTVRYHHAVIHRALHSAVKWGLINRNVADGVDVPRTGHTEMHTWDEYEINRFLDTARDSLYYALFHTAIYTGMRRSELLALRWLDVDFIFSQISVSRSLHHLKDGSYIFTHPKSAKSKRTISLSSFAIVALHEHRNKQEVLRAPLGITLKDDDLVFSTLEGKPLRPNTITRAWNTIAQNAGVKIIRLHDARHSHASLMLKAGIHPKIVQERLGHSTIAMTLDTYSHVTPGLQQAAAESFDRLLNPKREYESVANNY
ncbi:tyrosine-type recombinase/integrase [Chloroflexota bacterium]